MISRVHLISSKKSSCSLESPTSASGSYKKVLAHMKLLGILRIVAAYYHYRAYGTSTIVLQCCSTGVSPVPSLPNSQVVGVEVQ